jgi:moderate conductance mechanosensitive channel
MEASMRKLAIETFEGYVPLAVALFRVLVLVILGYIAMIIISRIIRAVRGYSTRILIQRGGLLDVEIEKRTTTVANVVRRTLLAMLWAAIIITALQEFGFKINALLAGAGLSAGIVGVAVGLGAQSLIKDVIAGLFMLIENQIRVGDVAIINGTGGAVEEINLRTTVLRSENGAVHVFPNGSVQTLANLTRDFSYFVFELALRHDQDTDRILAVMREVAEELRADPIYGPLMLAGLDVLGVDRVTQTGVVLKARIKTLPIKQWFVGREMNRRMRIRFAGENLMLGPEPTALRVETMGREQIKDVVREVLQEIRPTPGAPQV